MACICSGPQAAQEDGHLHSIDSQPPLQIRSYKQPCTGIRLDSLQPVTQPNLHGWPHQLQAHHSSQHGSLCTQYSAIHHGLEPCLGSHGHDHDSNISLKTVCAPADGTCVRQCSPARRWSPVVGLWVHLILSLCACAPTQLAHAILLQPAPGSLVGLPRSLLSKPASNLLDPVGPQMLSDCMHMEPEKPPLTWSRAMKDEQGALQGDKEDAGSDQASPGRRRRRERHLQASEPQGGAVQGGSRAKQVQSWKLSSRLETNLKEVVMGLDTELKAAGDQQAGSKSSGSSPSRQVLVHDSGAGSSRPDTSLLSPRNQELLQLAEQAVAALHEASERLDWACQLDVVLVYEVLGDARTATLLYPVNQLRNLARLQARTELIAQLDVDMLLSHQLYAWLQDGDNEAHMLQACRSRTVYVLPAFQAHGNNVSHEASLADHYITQPKEQVKQAMDQKILHHFDALRFPQGHNTTNFPRWFGTSKPYPITYTYRFEPWLIVHRRLAPWHDVRFRGYGNNKIQQVCHLNATGYTFVVHPAAFIVHRAHALTEARKQLITDLRGHLQAMRRPGSVANNGTLYGHTKHLFEAAKEAMDAGTFAPVLDPATLQCIGTLPWYAARK